MIEAIQKLITKNRDEEINGYLTTEDIKKLRTSRLRMSTSRKKTYKTWKCADCGHSCFYSVMRCSMCASKNISELVHPTNYEFSHLNDDSEILNGNGVNIAQ
jgi:rubrerythrin